MGAQGAAPEGLLAGTSGGRINRGNVASLSHRCRTALRQSSIETPLTDYLELLCLLRRAAADLEKGWPEAAYDALGRALRVAQAAEDVIGMRRIACQLLDDGLSEGEVAAILGWDLDLVRRAVADRSQAAA